MKTNLPLCLAVTVCLASILSTNRGRAQGYAWSNPLGGYWLDPGNWSPTGGPPLGSGNSASITLFGSMTITLSTGIEVDSLTLGSAYCSLTGGNLLLDKGLNWSSGTLAAPVQVSCAGDTELTGDAAHVGQGLSGVFINGGTANWSGSGSISLFSGGAITNNGTFNCAGTGAIGNGAGANLFFNSSSGTLTSQPLSANSIFVPVINEGSIQLQGGTLTFDNVFTSDGPISVASSGSLVLSAPSVALNAGSPVSGPGAVTMDSASVNVAGKFTAGLNLTSGTVNFNGPGPANLAVCNLTNGTLGGSNLVQVNGPLTWVGGAIAGTSNVVANGGLNLLGANLAVLGGTLVNTASAVWTNAGHSGSLGFGNGASFSNAPGATFTCNLNGTLGNSSVPPSQFNNAGTFVMRGNGTIASYLLFNNSGNVDVETGVLNLSNGGTNSGTFTVQSNATLAVAGGTQWFNPGSSVGGGGLVSVLSGTLNLAGDLVSNAVNIAGGTMNWLGSGAAAPSTVTLSSGTLGGTHLLTVNGAMTWLGGTLSNIGGLVARDGMALGYGGNSLNLNGSTVINTSNTTWTGTPSGAIILAGGSVLSNAVGAILDCLADTGMVNSSGANLFANAGLFRKTGGSGSTAIGVPFSNSGTTEVQTATVTLNNATNTGLITVFSNATLALASGTQWFNPGSSIAGGGLVSVLGGKLNLAGNLVSNAVNVAGGTMNCLGTGALAPWALNVASGILGGSNQVTVTGPMTWVGGTLSDLSGVLAKGGMALGNASASLNLDGGTLINASNATWTGTPSGAIILAGGSVLSNAVGAVLDCLADTSMANSSGANLFANAGLFRKTGGSGSTAIGVPFSNSGTTEVQTATLALNNATNTGLITVFSNATLALASGTQWFNPGSSIAGGGLVSVLGGKLNLAGNLVSNAVNVAGGTMNCLGTGALAPWALNVASGILGGSNQVTVTGPMTWVGGTLADLGGVLAKGGMALGNASASLNLDGGTLINASNATWTGTPSGAIILAGGSVLSNAVGAVFDCLADTGMVNSSGANLFANAGLFRKTGGSGSTAIGVPFSNSGTTEVQTATLTLNNAVTCIGTMIVSNVATLALAGGTQNYDPGSSVTGGGSVAVSSGTVNFAGDFTSNILSIAFGSTVNFNGTNRAAPAVLNITNGTVGGSNLVTVAGPMRWLAGTLGGTNAVLANGGLSIGTGSAGVSLAGRTLVNGAVGEWTGNTISLSSGAVFSNAPAGTFDCTFDGTISDNGDANLIANAGLFRKTGGTNSTLITTPFNNTGTVEVQTGTIYFLSQPYVQSTGTTSLIGGNIANSSPLQILGGTLRGNGSILGSVTNAGTVQPGASSGQGQMSVSGGYTQAPSGALSLGISGAHPGDGFGVLAVGNTAVLGGSLNVTLTNGFFPATNATFTFLTCGSRSGTFSRFNYPSNDYVMTLLYTATNVTLQVVSVPAPPSAIASLQYGNPGPGSNTLGFFGMAGYQYAIQYATNVTGPWVDFSTNAAGINGTWFVVDPNATNAARFYRARSL